MSIVSFYSHQWCSCWNYVQTDCGTQRMDPSDSVEGNACICSGYRQNKLMEKPLLGCLNNRHSVSTYMDTSPPKDVSSFGVVMQVVENDALRGLNYVSMWFSFMLELLSDFSVFYGSICINYVPMYVLLFICHVSLYRYVINALSLYLLRTVNLPQKMWPYSFGNLSSGVFIRIEILDRNITAAGWAQWCHAVLTPGSILNISDCG